MTSVLNGIKMGLRAQDTALISNWIHLCQLGQQKILGVGIYTSWRYPKNRRLLFFFQFFYFVGNVGVKIFKKKQLPGGRWKLFACSHDSFFLFLSSLVIFFLPIKCPAILVNFDILTSHWGPFRVDARLVNNHTRGLTLERAGMVGAAARS